MDIGDLESSLAEMFVANVVNEQGKYVTPLNADELSDALLASAQRERDAQGEIADSLREVLSAARAGGITPELYDVHSYAINSVARDATEQRWWGSALDHLCVREDQEAKSVGEEQLARFPSDGNYGAISNTGKTHVNVFDEPSKSSGWEGTLFHREYGESGNLRQMRIFHQGHRNSLKITTIDSDDLIEAMESYVAEYDALPEVSSVTLPLTKGEYLKKIDSFNEQFGDAIRVKILNTGRQNILVAELPENPQHVAEWFNQAAPENGIDGYANRGSITYAVGDQNSYEFNDLFLEVQLTQPMRRTEFDISKHAEAHTVIVPHFQPHFSIQFLKLYAETHSSF